MMMAFFFIITIFFFFCLFLFSSSPTPEDNHLFRQGGFLFLSSVYFSYHLCVHHRIKCLLVCLMSSVVGNQLSIKSNNNNEKMIIFGSYHASQHGMGGGRTQRPHRENKCRKTKTSFDFLCCVYYRPSPLYFLLFTFRQFSKKKKEMHLKVPSSSRVTTTTKLFDSARA